MEPMETKLTTFAWLSIGAAVATIGMKVVAFFLTGSVGLLSDAMESLVNLVAAVIALIALYLAGKPANSRFTYGRSKAEYFSAGIEGGMIFIAAAAIIFTAIYRILHPQPLESLGVGMLVSVGASLLNAAVGIILIRAGKRHRSPTLTADGKHLLTDVITSVGVVIGVALVAATHWEILDPIVAILVGLNITFTGYKLVISSLAGLMDAALPDEANERLVEVLATFQSEDVRFHGLQTRQSGRDSYANVDLLVPGSWSVAQGHRKAEEVSAAMTKAIDGLRVLIHVEPIEDPLSYEDIPTGYIPLPSHPQQNPKDATDVGLRQPPQAPSAQ